MNESQQAIHRSSFIVHRSSLLPAVMGILNITPDSFSDGGVHFNAATAVDSAMQMESDGAAILDIGGESTRPGSEEVPADVELERVIPVIEEIRRRSEIPISIDTRKARVAEAALDAGANVINDVSALRHDPEMRPLAASRGVPVILMHMRGEPRTMQQTIHYDEVVSDVARELGEWCDEARQAGVQSVFVDPGIGFGKTFEHNLELLARCDELARIAPVVIGASRKAFIGHLTGREAGPARAIGSLAAVAAAHRGGAAMVRVHDVRETVDFLEVLRAIEERRR
ncbi:MAG TPA: dihydropteroate synthase [Thermoanaerobaculia bacterium]|nr:dihydropteroate synthase [Thermoanaerobaculia bacterium]